MSRRFRERIVICCCLVIVSIGFGACVGGGQGTYSEGAQLYQQHCASCHMEDGTGFEALYPPLANADLLHQLDVAAACVVRNGLEGRILVNGVEYEMGMPAQPQLSAVEITNILNYIHNAWGNKRAYISLSEVEHSLEKCSPKD